MAGINVPWSPKLQEYLLLAEQPEKTAELINKIHWASDMSPDEWTELLHQLSGFGRQGSMAALVARGGDVNGYNDEGCTPLNSCMDAIHGTQTNHNALVSFIELLSLGADPNLPLQQRCFSPLHLAISRNLPDFAATLLAFGADPLAESPDYNQSNLDLALQDENAWPDQLLRAYIRK
jgi:ankyrin repeat protein